MPARMIGIAAALVGLSCGSVSTQSAQARASGTQSGFFINGDVRLSYRLDLPARTGRVPAVVFGHGSGRQSKASCRFLADGFLSRGFATLCYDKRGVGESSAASCSSARKTAFQSLTIWDRIWQLALSF